jgi:tRNA threonylcarbamoyladenosine modification (KEOPS) complex  Pcc1 subunit
MDIKTDTIVITITSNDITAAKANFNAIMRWISVVSEAIQLIPKKIVKNLVEKIPNREENEK